MKLSGTKLFTPLLLVSPFLQPATCQAEVKRKKPNIIFILVDDLRWDAMGFTGKYPFLKTPNIDQIRNEGVHFENAFCTHSLCAPSRATILTGLHSHIHGVNTNQEGREYDPDKTPSFAQILQGNGYETAFIGKWHMAERNSPRKGFDYWCSFSGQGNYNGNILNINGKEIRNDGYITDELNKYTTNFIEENADKPFCVYLSHKAVHQPFTPALRHQNFYADDLVPEPPGWRDNMESKPAWQRIEPSMEQRHRLRDKDLSSIRYYSKRNFGPWPAKAGKGEQKNYLRSISAIDEGIGEIYKLLREKGILDNTVIVFAGDNGFFHGEHGKGDKRLAYNESMRIPLVMRYPGVAGTGKTVSEMVLTTDIAPTFLEMAGVPVTDQMQGKSLVPLLQGRKVEWRNSFLFTYWPDLIHFLPRITAVRTDKYLYSTTPDIDDIDELYDLQTDPYEMKNLAKDPAYADLKKKMAAELELAKKEAGYRAEVPRPDPEPVLNVKSGLLFSVDFEKDSKNDFPGKGINLEGVISDINAGFKGEFDKNSTIKIDYNSDLNPALGTFIIECIVKPSSPDGVILSSGNFQNGYVLYLENGIPGFVVGHNQHLQFADGKEPVSGRWCHLAAVIENYHNKIKLFADGKLVGERQMLLPIAGLPAEDNSITLGKDVKGLVDSKSVSQQSYEGLIKQVTLYRQKMTNEQLIKLTATN